MAVRRYADRSRDSLHPFHHRLIQMQLRKMQEAGSFPKATENIPAQHPRMPKPMTQTIVGRISRLGRMDKSGIS